MANPKAPPGGFQNGAWYEGRQYWNGTFGAPGVGNNPNQTDIFQKAAPTFNAADKAYVAAEEKTYYSSPQDVQTALNATQNGIYGSSGSVPGVQSSAQILSDLKAGGLLPTNPAPAIPNSAQQFQDLSTAKGVDAIQASIIDLKAQAEALVAQTRTNTSAEQGKPVATNVIEGRVSVQKTQAQEQLDFINRQLTVKQDQMTAALGSIKMIMDFTQTDYTNASNEYNRQFDQAIATINLIHGIQQDQKTDIQRAQDNARANAQIFVNAIQAGNLDIHNLPPDQQANLNKLEVQSGLPVGFFSAIKADAKANIISTSTNNGVTQVLMRNPDGSISMQNYGTSTGGGTLTERTQAAQQQYSSWAAADAKKGATLQQMVSNYAVAGGLSVDEVYRLYNSNTTRGQAKETLAQVKQGVYSNQKGFVPAE